MADPLDTVLCARLGCAVPIVQSPMGWVAEPALVAASCEAGAFGFIGGAVKSPDQLRAAIEAVCERTDQPFGVNFQFFQPESAEIAKIVLAHSSQVRAVSFGRGVDAAWVRRFKEAGLVTMPTVGALKHAIKMAEIGVDMIVVQGGEGGGHTGDTPTTVLLPQVLDAVDIPVVAAGGFADGRGLAAALAWGAVGVAMGTRFLLTAESPVPDTAKSRYLAAAARDILVTRKIDGLPQRVVRNRMVDSIESTTGLAAWPRAIAAGFAMKRRTGASWRELAASLRAMRSHGGFSLRQALMAASAPSLIRRGVVEGEPDEGVLATGMVAARIDDIPTCADLVARIAADARERLADFAHPAKPKEMQACL